MYHYHTQIKNVKKKFTTFTTVTFTGTFIFLQLHVIYTDQSCFFYVVIHVCFNDTIDKFTHKVCQLLRYYMTAHHGIYGTLVLLPDLTH